MGNLRNAWPFLFPSLDHRYSTGLANGCWGDFNRGKTGFNSESWLHEVVAEQVEVVNLVSRNLWELSHHPILSCSIPHHDTRWTVKVSAPLTHTHTHTQILTQSGGASRRLYCQPLELKVRGPGRAVRRREHAPYIAGVLLPPIDGNAVPPQRARSRACCQDTARPPGTLCPPGQAVTPGRRSEFPRPAITFCTWFMESS